MLKARDAYCAGDNNKNNNKEKKNPREMPKVKK